MEIHPETAIKSFDSMGAAVKCEFYKMYLVLV
jgi:hypothetical protein